MIARFWTARIAKAHAPAYADHLKSQVLATLRSVDGYIGAKLLERETADGVGIVVITFWQSLDSIEKFAGPDLEKAVVSDEVVSLFLQYDRHVRHYEVVVTDDVSAGISGRRE
ncbi:MAG: antibiotic biosynthesis monooxygenase [Blastocatellia bacterium]